MDLQIGYLGRGGDGLMTYTCEDVVTISVRTTTCETGKYGCAAVISGQRTWRKADSEPARPIQDEPPAVRHEARE